MTDTILVERRGPGRPKGSRNRDKLATIDRINQEGDPIGFLCRVVKGRKIYAAPRDGSTARSWIFPTLDQRKDAAATLARKVIPDMRPSDIGIAINRDGDVTLQVISDLRPAFLSARPGRNPAQPKQLDQAQLERRPADAFDADGPGTLPPSD